MESVRVRFGHRVRQLREHAGLSQEELGHRSGLGGGKSISAIERGQRNLTLENIARLAGGLGVEMREVLALRAELAPRVADRGLEAAIDELTPSERAIILELALRLRALRKQRV